MNLPSRIKGWLVGYASPEQALIDFLKSGNRDKLSYVIDHYNQSIFHYLLTLTNQNLAEDILQTTWLKVLQSHHKDKPQKKVIHAKSWLYTIARNSLIDELRKSKQWQDIEQEELASESLSPPEQLSQRMKLKKFNDALEKLPFLQREAFIFRQEGFSLQEIGQLTNSEVETVKSRLRYAKNHFKSVLGVEK